MKTGGGSEEKEDQVSISPTFYEKLLCVQIPKAQKYSQVVNFFALSGSWGVKAAHKTMMKLTPGHYQSKKLTRFSSNASAFFK